MAAMLCWTPDLHTHAIFMRSGAPGLSKESGALLYCYAISAFTLLGGLPCFPRAAMLCWTHFVSCASSLPPCGPTLRAGNLIACAAQQLNSEATQMTRIDMAPAKEASRYIMRG